MRERNLAEYILKHYKMEDSIDLKKIISIQGIGFKIFENNEDARTWYNSNNNINLSYFNIMSAIALYFNVNLYSRERNLNLLLSLNKTYKLYYSYKVIVANLHKNIKVIEYFNKYSLLSSKHLDFLDWSKLVILINNEGQSINLNGSWELGINLRKDYNKTRTTFTWFHLKNTYLENK